MRVVWMTHNYPRFAGDVAGAFLHPLAVELRSRGVDVRVVAPSDAGKGGSDVLDGVPVTRVRYGTTQSETLAYTGTMTSALKSPSAAFAFNRMRSALRAGADAALTDSRGPAVVHAHWWIPSGLAAPVGVPMVLTCHGTDVRLLERIPFAGALARPTFRRARVVTTVSRSLAEIVLRQTGVIVRDDAIQPMPVMNVDRPWTDRSGDVVVVGRLTSQKRVHLAIEAAAQPGTEWRLRIVGDGAARPELEQQARQLGVADRVRFVGAVPPSEIPAVFATASCCIMPAEGEGFGLAAAEAFMQGVPVVACRDGGGLCELVPPTGAGRLVSPSATSIADGVSALIADSAAHDAARVLGLEWRAKLSAQFVADRCMSWYERALDA